MILQNFFLFKDLTIPEAEAIAQFTKQQTYPPRTLLIEQGTAADAVFFVLEGSVMIYRLTEEGEEISLGILGTGEIIGEMALIDNQARSAYVKTLTTTTLLVLSNKEFHRIIEDYPKIALHLLYSLTQRVRKSDEHLETTITENLSTRTWNTLNILTQYFPDNEIALTHQELASIVGGTRARITEILNKLEENNRITLSQRKIKVLL
ncbi:MAG: Crp/Fnr family transcriptional regulator [Candidatus Levybacteria bacterium]|nr:Crp/Fnr family transcriptional regulator [Candidatus Levybacteria bacterium]